MSEDANVEFLFGVEKSASGASWIAPKNYQENIKDLFIQELNMSHFRKYFLLCRTRMYFVGHQWKSMTFVGSHSLV